MVQGRLVPQSTGVDCVRYLSPSRWGLAAVFGLGGAALLTAGIRALPEHQLDALVIGLLVALMVWAAYLEAWVMETSPGGLYVRYSFGNSVMIPYGEIQRVTVRGRRLQIHTASKFSAETEIAIGAHSQARRSRADELIAAITQAAGLTKFSKSFFGWPTYDRE